MQDVLAKSMNFWIAACRAQYMHRFQWNLVCIRVCRTIYTIYDDSYCSHYTSCMCTLKHMSSVLYELICSYILTGILVPCSQSAAKKNKKKHALWNKPDIRTTSYRAYIVTRVDYIIEQGWWSIARQFRWVQIYACIDVCYKKNGRKLQPLMKSCIKTLTTWL